MNAADIATRYARFTEGRDIWEITDHEPESYMVPTTADVVIQIAAPGGGDVDRDYEDQDWIFEVSTGWDPTEDDTDAEEQRTILDCGDVSIPGRSNHCTAAMAVLDFLEYRD